MRIPANMFHTYPMQIKQLDIIYKINLQYIYKFFFCFTVEETEAIEAEYLVDGHIVSGRIYTKLYRN